MSKFETPIKKAITWLTCGSVNGKPAGDITYHCQMTTEDWLEEGPEKKITVTYDFPTDEHEFTEEIMQLGNERLLKELKEKLKENE